MPFMCSKAFYFKNTAELCANLYFKNHNFSKFNIISFLMMRMLCRRWAILFIQFFKVKSIS